MELLTVEISQKYNALNVVRLSQLEVEIYNRLTQETGAVDISENKLEALALLAFQDEVRLN